MRDEEWPWKNDDLQKEMVVPEEKLQ